MLLRTSETTLGRECVSVDFGTSLSDWEGRLKQVAFIILGLRDYYYL